MPAPRPASRATRRATGSSSFEPVVDSQGMYFGTTRDGSANTNLYFAPRAGNGFASKICSV